jgi:hypothetical protein
MIHPIVHVYYLFDKEPEYIQNYFSNYINKLKKNKIELEYLQNNKYENYYIIDNLKNINKKLIFEYEILNNKLNSKIKIIDNLENINKELKSKYEIKNNNLISIMNKLKNDYEIKYNKLFFINIYLCFICIMLKYIIYILIL